MNEQYDALQEAAEKVNYGPHEKEPFVLMLPPGADGKAHPAFWILHSAANAFQFWPQFKADESPDCWTTLIRCEYGFSRIAAAAIAHYWRQYFWRQSWGGTSPRMTRLSNQIDAWTAIAAGEGDKYKDCKIVEYKNV